MKKKIITGIILIFLALWVGLGVYLVGYDFNVKEVVIKKETEKAKKEEPVVSKISLVAVGDALIHDGVYAAAKTKSGYDFKPMMRLIKERTLPFDLAFYNQETILGGTALGLSNWPRFNSPQEVGDAMIDAGFNLVGRANNHTLDKGEKAVLAAETYWAKQTGVLTAGSYISEEARTAVKIKEVNNIKYALLSYTTTTNGLNAPTGKEYYVDTYDKDKVKTDIERIGNQADLIIVSMHWGSEFVFVPTAQEYEIAQYLASLGVDIIIGHHPHVVQSVQFIGDTLVIYSLGNLISAHESSEINKKIGLMVAVDITKTEFKGQMTIKLSNVVGTLLYNPNSSALGKYVVYPFDQVDNSVLKNYQNYYTQYSGYVKVDDAITIKEL